MGPFAGHCTGYSFTDKVNLNPDLVCFAKDNMLSWSESVSNIFDSFLLSGRGQLMLRCNELMMGVLSGWKAVCLDLEGQTWLYSVLI